MSDTNNEPCADWFLHSITTRLTEYIVFNLINFTGSTQTKLCPTFQIQMTKRFGKFGKFTFSAHDSGEHFFCFQTNSTRFSVFAGESMVRTIKKKKKLFSQI